MTAWGGKATFKLRHYCAGNQIQLAQGGSIFSGGGLSSLSQCAPEIGLDCASGPLGMG